MKKLLSFFNPFSARVILIMGILLSSLFLFSGGKAQDQATESTLKFSPPKPQDAPAEIKDMVMMGYNIVQNTQEYAKEYVGNDMNCSTCHKNAGMDEQALPLVGVAAVFPKFKKRANGTVDLVMQTNACLKGALKGKPMAPDSKEMLAILTYYQWISKGIPIYANVPWLGKKQ